MMQAQDFPLVSHSPKRWAAFVQSRTPILESIVPLNSRGQRDWKVMGDESLIAHSIWKIDDGHIDGRYMLVKGDSGLYQVLLRRKLLDLVGVQNSNKGDRNWAGMENSELIAYAREIIAGSRITGRRRLQEIDSGLYVALQGRKLMDDVGLSSSKNNNRDWASVERVELIAHAKRFVEKRGLRKRGELRRADSAQYLALWRRRLLDAVFSDVESPNHKEAVDGVLDAVKTFGD